MGERSLEPSPQLAATDLNRQVEDVNTVLKFIFTTQKNSFSVIDFLIPNLLLHAYRLVRLKIVLELSKTIWNFDKISNFAFTFQ